MDKRIDCGTCGRRARGPWPVHASTDAHRRNSAPKVKHVPAWRVRRENNASIAYRSDPWADDGRDWDAEEARDAR